MVTCPTCLKKKQSDVLFHLDWGPGGIPPCFVNWQKKNMLKTQQTIVKTDKTHDGSSFGALPPLGKSKGHDESN